MLAAHGYISWPDGSQSAPVRAPIGDISPFLLDLVRRPVEEMSVDDIAELSGRLTLQARRSFTVSLRAVIPETRHYRPVTACASPSPQQYPSVHQDILSLLAPPPDQTPGLTVSPAI